MDRTLLLVNHDLCPPETKTMTWKERILLLLLAAINFTHILDFMIMMPLGNFLMPYFRIDAQQFSVVLLLTASALQFQALVQHSL
jgi:hypothetical protein